MKSLNSRLDPYFLLRKVATDSAKACINAFGARSTTAVQKRIILTRKFYQEVILR